MTNFFQHLKLNRESANQADVRSFFTNHCPNGYFSTAQFMNYVQDLNRVEFFHLHKMFNYTSKGYPLNNLLEAEPGEIFGQSINRCFFTLPNAQIDLRICFKPEIQCFLKAHQENIDQCQRELNDLIDEAMSI